ncbi:MULTISPECIES: SsgA family sporulation/cell division regulator [unclassified Streptomyces]|uniref:SsgA family sporulation/cell division regulator n=1 Tax=unclassified Streptomyces TaxID=2593676 RepID=UPI00069AA5DA|nr:SsgA family sporulation/cell division regulator [Streptomyces sp. NRRL S-31]
MNSDRSHTGHEASARCGPPALVTTLWRLFGPDGPAPLLCRMRYTVDDPYAVALDLFGDPDTDVCVTWVVARDLLAGGTRRPSGEGDFRVWPSCRRAGEPARLCFSLIGPGGYATFEADLTDVRHWLDATYALVPSGTEHRMIDWDALTAHWFDRT